MSSDQRESLERVAGPVSRETFEHLLAFEASFRKWAARINLASQSTLDELWTRHVLDSAQLWPLAPDAKDWVDVGSGGGFPGAVLAILRAGEPGCRVRLVESSGKKCAFLRTVLSEHAPGAEVHCRRIEACVAAWEPPQIVTARALAPLHELLRMLEKWLAGGTRGLFHKGREYRGEIERARDSWNLDLLEHPSVVDSRSVVLEVRGLRRR